jgi:putative nucleotidyltransferase with HDIG domain
MTTHHIDRQTLAQQIAGLPALPQAALDALAALRANNASIDHCSELIGRDQALVARVLRLANSAFYGVPGRVGTIRDAVQLLGRRTLANLLTTVTLSQQFDARSCPSFAFDGFWCHSIAVALACRSLAQALRVDEEQAFTVGLLHDIGRLALAAQFPRQMDAALRRAQEVDDRQTAIEREVLGVDHVEVGTWIAAHWRFPDAVMAAIAGHHAPPTGGHTASLVDIVHVANALAHALDLTGDPNEIVPVIDPAAFGRLALPPSAWLQVLADTERGVAGLGQAMGFSPTGTDFLPTEPAALARLTP